MLPDLDDTDTLLYVGTTTFFLYNPDTQSATLVNGFNSVEYFSTIVISFILLLFFVFNCDITSSASWNVGT